MPIEIVDAPSKTGKAPEKKESVLSVIPNLKFVRTTSKDFVQRTVPIKTRPVEKYPLELCGELI